MSNISIDQQLNNARIAINNALNSPDIQAALTPFSYDPTRLNEALTLYNEARALVEQQRQEYGEQYQASQVFQAAWDAAQTAYNRSHKIAKVAFKNNPDAQTALMLSGTRKRSFPGWLTQALTFYDGLLNPANAPYLAAISPYTYTAEKLQAELDLVQKAAQLDETLDREKREAQQATKTRDTKLDDLSEWLADFKLIAQVALADTPQSLEALGFGAIA